MSSLSKRTFGWLSLAIAGVIAGLTPQTHAQEQLWIRQFGTTAVDGAEALAPDGAGGVMVAGWTRGSLGGPSAGGRDAFLARYDNAGERLWIRQFGTGSEDRANALAVDGAGGVMVAGYTFGSFGGPNAGSRDAFLARYDSAGDRLWTRQFGTSSEDIAHALAPDGAGGVLVAGFTYGSLGGPNPDPGYPDAFLARYDGAGERLWTRQFGTSNTEVAYALAPDGAGGVMVAGYTNGSLGGPHAGYGDVFLARYDSAGNQLWIRQFGTSGGDWPSALAPDGAGGVLVAGLTYGSLGGPHAGGQDAFLARYDSAGDRLWIRQFGTSETDYASALAPDGAGGVLVAGSTWGSLGGPNAGEFDAFLARYDNAGDRLWIRQFGTSYRDQPRALAPDGAGGVMVAGWIRESALYDAFLARFSVGCVGDLDGDGDTDLADLGILLADFGCTLPGPCVGDLTGDGITDLADLGILLADFGCVP